MTKFTDAKGREWHITLSLGMAMRIKDELDVDLLQPEAGDPPLLTRLGTEEILLGQVLCVFLSDQFELHGLTETDVKYGFDGATLLAAQQAFYEELGDFFRSRGRSDRAKAITKQVALITAAVKANETRIDGFDVSETIRDALSESSPGTMSGESPAASASTLDP